MITLYGFGNIFPAGIGETKDLRAQWALEETGLPYRVHALDHTGGELDGEAYSRISPFHQVPVIDDDGFVVAESAAVVLYLAEKAGKLIPGDVRGRTRVVQWCFAAAGTVEPTLLCLDIIQIFDRDMNVVDIWTHFGRPSGVWILKDDTLIVSDSESNQRIGGPDDAVEGGGNAIRNPGWKNGIRIGSAKDGSLKYFIDATQPEGLAADEMGNIFGGLTGGCEASKSGGCLQKFVRK